jgi:DNA-binding GntR family transcriptional regulator
LSSAILTKKFRAGDKLPSRNELAKSYNVAPMTVQAPYASCAKKV